MEYLEPRSKTAFRRLVQRFTSTDSDQYVFRGQAREYATIGGQRSFASSIERSGCIPPIMLKWSFCVNQILYFLKGPSISPTLEASSAILQHYGWRSFYVDLTSSFTVAAWFGSNQYHDRIALHMVEDCFEDPILEGHRPAEYVSSNEPFGWVYVFDKEAIEGLEHLQAYDVMSETAGASLRAGNQRAWLVTSQPWMILSALLNKTLVAIIKAPAHLLLNHATEQGITQQFLFPTSEDDAVIRMLMSFPRIVHEEARRAEETKDSIVYCRLGLDIPEYADPFHKRYPPNIAFDYHRWLPDIDEFHADGEASVEEGLRSASFIRISESDFYGSSNIYDSGEGAAILSLLQRFPDVVFEVNALIPVFPDAEDGQYAIGVRCRLLDDIVNVTEITADHPGLQLVGIGEFYGRFYKVDSDGYLVEVDHAEKCPCNNELKHLISLASIKRIALSLQTGEAEIEDSGGHFYLHHKGSDLEIPLLAQRGYGIEQEAGETASDFTESAE